MLPNSDPATLHVLHETPSSIELTQNSKGEAQFTIKLYCEVGNEEVTAERSIALYERVRQWAKEQHA